MSLDIESWLIEIEGNPNAEISFKRVVKILGEYRNYLQKDNYSKIFHYIKFNKTISVSDIMKYLCCGINEASAIMDKLELDKIVEPFNGDKNRKIIMYEKKH